MASGNFAFNNPVFHEEQRRPGLTPPPAQQAGAAAQYGTASHQAADLAANAQLEGMFAAPPASASQTEAPTTRGGRPRTGRPRWSMRPVWRASDSPSEVARTTYLVCLRSPPGLMTISSLLLP